VTTSTFQRRLSPQLFARRLPHALQSPGDQVEGEETGEIVEIEEIEETVVTGLVHPADMKEGTRRPVALPENSLLTSVADAVMEDHRVVMVATGVDLAGLDVVGVNSEVATGEIHHQALEEIDSQVVVMVEIVNKVEVALVVIVSKVEVALVVIVNKVEVALAVIVNKVEVGLAVIVNKEEEEEGLVVVVAVLAVVVEGEGEDLHHPSKNVFFEINFFFLMANIHSLSFCGFFAPFFL